MENNTINKISNMLSQLDEKELLTIKKNLTTGKVERIISQKIEEKRQETNLICPVCQNLIKEDAYTLIFGPQDFRKKASFCATDCLEYFIHKIKENKKTEVKFYEKKL